MGNLTFNEELHEYRLDGVVIPSVTQLIKEAGLSNFDMVNPDLLLRSIQFGKAVHKAIELKSKGTLDELTVDPIISAYAYQWEKFVKDFEYKQSTTEFRSVNTALKVGYCLDSVGVIGDQSALVDIKTGSPKPADLIQVSGYGYLYPSQRLLIVYLNYDSYKVEEIKRLERKKYERIFLSCFNLWNFKKEKGLL